MDRLHYELLCKKVWEIFPFVMFDYDKHSLAGNDVYVTLISAIWAYKGKDYKSRETIHSDMFDLVADKDAVVMASYRKIIDAILESIEEVNNEN